MSHLTVLKKKRTKLYVDGKNKYKREFIAKPVKTVKLYLMLGN
jgi:hypothetical protein